MMLLNGNANRIWRDWMVKYPGKIGMLASPSYWRIVPIDKTTPFVLDNGAFVSYNKKEEWSPEPWRKMIAWFYKNDLTPKWACVPDVVANREKTIARWNDYKNEIKSLGWLAAFCVQDGMTEKDIPKDADILFVGGTRKWKLKTIPLWVKAHPRVHAARINPIYLIEFCEKLGCESVDGTGWFREPSHPKKVPALKMYLDGYRTEQNQRDFFNQ